MKFLLCFLLLTNFSYAGSKVGNGGDGVIIKDQEGQERPYLLDLVEKGVHLDPYFKNTEDYSEAVKNEFMAQLELDDNIATLLAAKLKEIDDISPLWGFLTKQVIVVMNWSFIEQELMDMDDHGDTVLNYNNLELVQLAVRKGFDVTINKTQWNKMDLANKVATLIHEAQYALSPLKKSTLHMGEKEVSFMSQQGSGARSLTGVLFSKSALNRWKDDWPKLLYQLDMIEKTYHTGERKLYYKDLFSQEWTLKYSRRSKSKDVKIKGLRLRPGQNMAIVDYRTYGYNNDEFRSVKCGLSDNDKTTYYSYDKETEILLTFKAKIPTIVAWSSLEKIDEYDIRHKTDEVFIKYTPNFVPGIPK